MSQGTSPATTFWQMWKEAGKPDPSIDMSLSEDDMAALLGDAPDIDQQTAPLPQARNDNEFSRPSNVTNVASRQAKSGRLEDAVETLKAGLKQFPDDARSHHMLGLYYSKLWKEEAGVDYDAQAEQHLLEAHRLKPDDHITLYEIGRLYSRQGRLQEAEEFLFKSLHANQNDHTTFWALGVVYETAGHFSAARGCYGHALAVAPEQDKFRPRINDTIKTSLTNVERFTEQKYSASDIAPIMQAFVKSERLVTSDVTNNIQIDPIGESKKLFEDKDIFGAIQVLENTLNSDTPFTDKKRASLYYHLGLNYAFLTTENIENRDGEAAECFEKAHELDGNWIHPLQQLGKVYTRQEDFEEAENVLFSALDINENDPFILHALGTLYLNNSRGSLHGEEEEYALARAAFGKGLESALQDERHRTMRIVKDCEKLLKETEEISGAGYHEGDYEFLREVWQEGQEDEGWDPNALPGSEPS